MRATAIGVVQGDRLPCPALTALRCYRLRLHLKEARRQIRKYRDLLRKERDAQRE